MKTGMKIRKGYAARQKNGCRLGAAIVFSLFALANAPQAHGQGGAGVLTKYTDPEQLTTLPFGGRSHWLQPWRAYSDTWPTSRLRDAVGINYKFVIPAAQADAVCKHLAKNGFKLLRVEFAWNVISYDDPNKLVNKSDFDMILGACKRNGLRPLILLNSNHGMPGPTKPFTVRLSEPAKRGDRTLKLDPQDLRGAVPGRSGLSNLTGNWAAEVLFTNIQSDGTVTLSKPLPKDIPTGSAPAATLKYLPFYPPKNKANGSTPPQFRETMQGWLDYVRVVTAEAKRALGTENQADAGFDLEIWNELTFGSNFLDINKYYGTPVMQGDYPFEEITRETVAFVRDPRNDLPRVGITNGFDSQRPWGAGSTAAPGLTAMSKHPYAGQKIFPKAQGAANGIRPVNALKQAEGQSAGAGRWTDDFIPTYVSYFPEYFLTGIQTETMVRDMAPIMTPISRVQHGRNVHPDADSSAPAPTIWVTEVNIDPRGADPGNLAEYKAANGRASVANLTKAQIERLKAKATLRYLTSFVNKGVQRMYFFCAQDNDPLGLGLISPAFFKVVATNGNQYPADDSALTSPTMNAVRRLTTAMSGNISASAVHPITLQRIEEPVSEIQFEGDPATANENPNPHPPLYNRDVLGFFPFQASAKKYVVPIYVMTRNMAYVYKSDGASDDVARFDMPAEVFRLTIGGVSGSGAKVSLYDPLNDKTYPVKTLSANGSQLKVEIGVTDSPRLLIIEQA